MFKIIRERSSSIVYSYKDRFIYKTNNPVNYPYLIHQHYIYVNYRVRFIKSGIRIYKFIKK